METRKLGYSDLHITPIGLGTFAMGGTGWKASWGPQNDKDSIDTIKWAMESGINWIDTAPVYGLAHAEEVVGNALEGVSPRPIMATKCSRIWDEKGKIVSNLKRDSIRAEIEGSLKRLRVEVIDLYQIHWPLPDEDIEEGWSAVAELVAEGKVRYGGVSNFNLDQLKRAQSIHPVASLQTPYSMLRRQMEKELLPYCEANGIGILVYSPMQKGLLTGKITPERIASLHKEDHRRKDPNFAEPRLRVHLDFVHKLETLASSIELTSAQLSLAWALLNPAVTSAIVGARQPEQLKETLKAGDIALAKATVDSVTDLLREHRENLRIALS